jgi:hypothetical protein
VTEQEKDWLDELERRHPEMGPVVDKVREAGRIDERFRKIMIAEGFTDD